MNMKWRYHPGWLHADDDDDDILLRLNYVVGITCHFLEHSWWLYVYRRAAS